MRLGQTTALTFASKFGSSVVSFFAILHFSRRLGPAALGTYFLAMAVVGWLAIPGSFSVDKALTKRLSEAGIDEGRFVSAALVLKGGLLVLLGALVLLFGPQLDAYVGLGGASVFIVLMLAAKSAHSFEHSVLEGQRRVHLSGLLQPVVMLAERGAQFAGVVLGFGVLALLGGYVVGTSLVVIVVVGYLSLSPMVPERYHFTRLLEFARYSWIGSVESKALSSMDTIVLGFFVLPGLVGIYNVAWNVASLLALFGFSLAETLFPEMSRSESLDADVGSHLHDSLAYTGLFLLPGLVGAIAIGNRVLAVYGAEFAQGGMVLVLLVGARLVYGYHYQFVNALNAIDRPELAFAVNLRFIAVNLGLNVVLVWQFGWIGAAVATLVSSMVVLVLSWRAVRGLVSYDAPASEIGRQAFAATGMGAVIYLLQSWFSGPTVLLYREIDTVVMVGVGAVVYFFLLLAISPGFRKLTRRNLPYIDGGE